MTERSQVLLSLPTVSYWRRAVPTRLCCFGAWIAFGKNKRVRIHLSMTEVRGSNLDQCPTTSCCGLDGIHRLKASPRQGTSTLMVRCEIVASPSGCCLDHARRFA